MREKCEPSSSPSCHLGLLMPRVTADSWDIWSGFMWVHGVWMLVRGKSLILCSFPWQAAPASAWQHTDRFSAQLMEEDVLTGIQNCSHTNIFWCLAVQMGQDLTSSTDLPCINHWKPLTLLLQGKTCSHPPWFYKWLNPLIQFLPHYTGVFPAEDLFHTSQLKDTQPRWAHTCNPAWARDLNILAETGSKTEQNLVLRGHVKWKTHKKIARA